MIVNVHMLAFHEPPIIRKVDVPEAELDGSGDLEVIYHYGQNDFQPQRCCSVSCGDVIEYKESLYLVTSNGFREIDKEEMFRMKALTRFDRALLGYT